MFFKLSIPEYIKKKILRFCMCGFYEKKEEKHTQDNCKGDRQLCSVNRFVTSHALDTGNLEWLARVARYVSSWMAANPEPGGRDPLRASSSSLCLEEGSRYPRLSGHEGKKSSHRRLQCSVGSAETGDLRGGSERLLSCG